MPRPWENFSDREFETFLADLFGAEWGVRFETFVRGRDLGIDLRHFRSSTNIDIVQAKHYKNYSDLKREAGREREKLSRMTPAPTTYRFVTSLGLTPHNKSELAQILAPFITRDDDIFGRDDLEGMLNRHPDVERQHIKLWLTGGTQLTSLINSGIFSRSRALLHQIIETLPRYVQGESFSRARHLLAQRHVLLIAGPPGIGKTTLARMLLADLIQERFEIINVSADIEEAWKVWDPNTKQAFLYDDFLGRTLLNELSKNEDDRLLTLMGEIGRSDNGRLILTSREYILKQAALMSEAFRRHGIAEHRFLLVLKSYSLVDKARILHNHIWHSSLSPDAKFSLSENRSYRKLLDHPNFSPRLVEYITGLQAGHKITPNKDESWLGFALRSLNHPGEIWKQAFFHEVGDYDRAVLLLLATIRKDCHLEDLTLMLTFWCKKAGLALRPKLLDHCLEVLEGTFVNTEIFSTEDIFARIANPGLIDFVQSQLATDAAMARQALEAAVYFEQLFVVWELIKAKRWAASLPEMSHGILRLFEAQSCEWGLHRVQYKGDSRIRASASLERRLELLIVLAGADTCPENLAATTQGLLSKRWERWKVGEGDPSAVIGLVRTLVKSTKIVADPEMFAALKSLLMDNLSTIGRWNDLIQFWICYPRGFEGDEDPTISLQEKFANFAYDELHGRRGPLDGQEELRTLLYVAENLEVTLDPESVSSAQESIDERLAEEDEASDRARNEWKDRGDYGDRQEETVVDRIFYVDKD